MCSSWRCGPIYIVTAASHELAVMLQMVETVLAQEAGWNVWLVSLPGLAICFGLRILAVKRDWRAPVPNP